MNSIETLVPERLRNCIWNTFQISGKRHLLLTGQKGCGKTTLIEALAGPNMPGIRSWVERDMDGVPLRVILGARNGVECCVIGERTKGAMQPVVSTLDGAGVELLHKVLVTSRKWVCVDEIGFLEESSLKYQQMLWQLFDEKRVLASVRKADTPFLKRVRDYANCLLLDLDGNNSSIYLNFR